jgi:DNA polymerase-1
MNVVNIEDTMVMSYVLDSAKNGHGMDELAKVHLNYTPIPYKQVTQMGKSQVTFDYVSLKSARDYAAEDADITLRLYNTFKNRLESEDSSKIYSRLDKPLIEVLLDMEQTGVMIDRDYLEILSDEFGKSLMALEKKIHDEVGIPFNIASPKQLGEILFGKLGLPAPKKSKTGQYSTNSDVLEDLAAGGVSLAQTILDWRQLAKLKSTYTDALVLKINAESKRIHTSFAQTITSTGRLSSSEPNLQNIPVRTDEGKKIRRAFIVPHGFKLVSFDYSQIELRILADMANIGTLKSYFMENRDIHVQTASRMFGIPEHEVTPELRRQAKTINFGIIYGMSAYGLSQALKISQSEAKLYIETYFKEFPEIKTYMDDTILFAKSNGYVCTLEGRKCIIPGIEEKNGFALRQAINAPIQGSNADMIKEAMILIFEFLKKEQYKTKMLLQVHDELLFEVPEDEIERVVPMIKELMEKTRLSIPTPVNYKVGDNWAQIHD